MTAPFVERGFVIRESRNVYLPGDGPRRIQLRRTKSWCKPAGAIVVARPSKWGNPFRYHDRTTGLVRYRPSVPAEFEYEGRISAPGMNHAYFGPDGTVTDYNVRWATLDEIVELYRRTLIEPDRGMTGAWPSRKGRFLAVTVDDIRHHLAGRDLACWCPLDQPCHADVLLELASGDAL